MYTDKYVMRWGCDHLNIKPTGSLVLSVIYEEQERPKPDKLLPSNPTGLDSDMGELIWVGI